MDIKFVRINNFNNTTDAEICKGKLEANDINCYLENAEVINRTAYFNTFGGINLLVDVNKVDEAKKLLNL
jgi:hypothetical protein